MSELEEEFENLCEEARELEQENEVESAIALYREALKIRSSSTVEQKIDALAQQVHATERPAVFSTPVHSQVRALQSDITAILSPVSAFLRQNNNETSFNNSVALADGDRTFDTARYNQLILEGKDLYKNQGRLREALVRYQEAFSLNEDRKLATRIQKIRYQIAELEREKKVPNTSQLSEDSTERYNDFVIQARSAAESGEIEEALSLYKAAYEIDPSEKLKTKMDELSKQTSDYSFDVEHYNRLILEAKAYLTEHEYGDALKTYEEAYALNPNNKLNSRITKIRKHLEEEEAEEEEEEVAGEVTKQDVVHNKSVVDADIDEICKALLGEAVQHEKEGNVQECLDVYRELHTRRPTPYYVSKIREMEGKLGVAEKEEEGEEGVMDVERYNNLILDGREKLNDGELEAALRCYQDALAMNYSEKLEKRIEKVKGKIAEEEQEEEEGGEGGEVDEDVQVFYEATIQDAKDKEERLLFDEAIALYTEANTLIPSERLVKKIAQLEFQRDAEEEEGKQEPTAAQSLSDLSTKDKTTYNEYVTKGKLAQKQSKVEKALNCFRKACAIYRNAKLVARISKLEAFLEREAEQENWYTEMGDGFFLANEVHEKLYPYQREGVQWMWSLYRGEHGGILGDDMGLGKTIQTIAFLQALFTMEEISTAMLVMPLSLVHNWQEEFQKWAPEIKVLLFHGGKAERERNVKRVMKRGGVAITTYGIIEKNFEFLVNANFRWDYLILDEGHKIKNPTKTSKAVRQVPCGNRLIISGTPIQNNLKELWALFDFASRGQLLGTMTTFKSNYINPIERGREKDASRAEAKLGAKLAESLRKVIDPYFLRRTKAEIKASAANSSSGVRNLGKKNELCVWLKLSQVQHDLYQAFLTLDSVRDAMNQTKSPLAALTVLKKICDHPRLAIKFEALREVMDAENMDMNSNDHKKLLDTLHLPPNPSDDMLLTEGCKLNFAVQLVELLHGDGHRTLFFSTSLKILNYIERMIGDRGVKCLRIDGSINKPADRQQIIDTFNTNKRFSVLLLTTQVGGVGLNLTSANRVVIYDPNWNPATDSQAVDRAYRIGQKKHVTVYRLLTCGTIEEKIYRKQVFKGGITRQATGDSFDPIRYFTNQEISQLFEFGSTDYSETCNQMEELHGAERAYSEEVKIDLDRVKEFNGVIGCSDHDLLFSHEEDNAASTPQEQQFVNERVEQAKRGLKTGAEGYDPRSTAVPLSSAPRMPQEPTRGHSMWTSPSGPNPMAELEEVEAVEGTESPYFERTSELPGKQVIVIDDDDEEETPAPVMGGEPAQPKKKLSLEQYRNMKQMKIYDYRDEKEEQREKEKGEDERLRVYDYKDESVDQRDMERRKEDEEEGLSDKEAAEDLDSSRYDNLNRPNCLDDSEEEEEEDDEEVVIVDHVIEKREQEEDSESEEEEEEEKENVKRDEVLADMISGVKIDSPHSSPAANVLKPRQETTVPKQVPKEKTPPKKVEPPKDELCPCGKLAEVVAKGYKVSKCRCQCSEEELAKYDRYLQRGLEHHRSNNFEKARNYYKAALQLRNDDLTVQKAYLGLKKQLK